MGLLEWLGRSLGVDLDRRVGGVGGSAEGTFRAASAEAPVSLVASLGNGHAGTITVRGAGRREEGRDAVAVDLGPAAELRGGQVVVESTVERASDALAVLTVEVSQPPLGRETYSVESRFDSAARAPLTITLRFA